MFFKGAFDLFLLPLDGGGGPRPLLAEPTQHELNGEVSPDGRWIAYQSNESGRHEIYVRPFPDIESGRSQISSEGGRYPLWARSGRELFYVTSGERLVSVQLQSGSGLTILCQIPLTGLSPSRGPGRILVLADSRPTS